MSLGKNILLLTLAVTAVCIHANVLAQDTVRCKRMQRIATVIDTAESPRYVFIRQGDCGRLYPYYPNVEYIFVPIRSKELCLPEVTRESYFDGKYWDDWWRLPQILEVEDVDGKKIISNEQPR